MYKKPAPVSVGICRQKVTINVSIGELVDQIAAAVESALSQQVELTGGVDVEDCDSEALILSAEYETPYSEYPAEDGTPVIVRETEFLNERAFRRELVKNLTSTTVAPLIEANIEEDADKAFLQ